MAGKIGRKWTLLSSSLFFAISNILLKTAGSVGQMYAARLFQVSHLIILYTVTISSICLNIRLNELDSMRIGEPVKY